MARWRADNSRSIIYRVIARGQLVLETPAHFGASEQDGTELIILRDPISGAPLLTGASQAGALRHYLVRREHGFRVNQGQNTVTTQLFGVALDEQQFNQSRLITYDALGSGSGLSLRNGVKIDGAWRTADDGALFNVQVWPEGTIFDLRLELYVCEADNKQGLIQAFAVLLQALTDGEIPLGARKHRGYGRCTVPAWHIDEYEITQQDSFLAWMQQDSRPVDAAQYLQQAIGFVDNRKRVRLKADFTLCDSLMIRAGADIVDSTQLTTANGQPVLSGTSIAGALRARAFKILHTRWSQEDAAYLVDDMFGLHGDKADQVEQLTASRLHIEEHIVEQAGMAHVQNRVKIDRFTGGAYETALISEQPAFATPETTVRIVLELQIPADAEKEHLLDRETGLLLLLIKDLWTQDLVLGGEGSIGRGRLQGQFATLEIGRVDAAAQYVFDANGLRDPAQAGELQRYVDALWSEEHE